MEIEVAKKTEYLELIKFMNKVFHLKFEKLIPKLYEGKSEFSEYHRIIRDNGKFVGAIATIPLFFHFGNSEIRGAGVGMVSVDKNMRGRGLMGKLVRASIQDATEKVDADIMFLTGNRQRYEYFGFVPSGVMHVFEVCKNNAEHLKFEEKFSFVPLKKDSIYLKKIYDLFTRQNVHWHREENRFYDIISGWNYKVKVILKSGEFFGYAITHRNGLTIEEINLQNEEDILKVASAMVCQNKIFGSLRFCIPHYQSAFVRSLTGFAERYYVEENCAIKILNYKRLIETYMNDAISKNPLPVGEINLKIDKDIYTVKVDKTHCIVEKNISEKFDYSLTEKEAVVALCSFNGVYLDNSLLRAWGFGSGGLCPVSVPHVDNV